MHRTLAPRIGFDDERLGAEPLHRRLAHTGLQRRLDLGDDRAIHRLHGCCCCVSRHAWLEPSEHVGPVGTAVFESRRVKSRLDKTARRDRHEDARASTQCRAAESCRGHTHDRERVSIDHHRCVDDRLLAAKTCQPIVMRQYCNGRFARGPIITGSQQPADSGGEAECLEVAAGDQQAFAILCLTLVGEVGAEEAMRGQAREGTGLLLEIPKHGITEDDIAVAGLIAGLRSGFRARIREVHQLIGRRHRQGLEQDLVEHREDGRVGTDAEGQRQGGDGRHERSFAQCAECQFQVRHDGMRRRNVRQSCRGLLDFAHRWPSLLPS
ncbi:MAG: hypothetical protein GHHEDOFH_02882 [Pseudorhodoplanes sp.]|nr:hypothetical protein [Pseudorhodoplanes sp.]